MHPSRLRVTTALLAVLLSLPGAARAEVEGEEATSVELRLRPASLAYRWSEEPGGGDALIGPGVGARFFPGGPNGIYVDFDYLVELDLGALNGDGYLDNDLVVARVGYVHRWVLPSRSAPERRATTVAVRAGGLIGVDLQRSDVPADEDVRAIAGFGAGVDVDFHVRRFFFGATLGFDVYFHGGGQLDPRALMGFGAPLPIGRIGFDLGPWPLPRAGAPAPAPAPADPEPPAPDGA